MYRLGAERAAKTFTIQYKFRFKNHLRITSLGIGVSGISLIGNDAVVSFSMMAFFERHSIRKYTHHSKYLIYG